MNAISRMSVLLAVMLSLCVSCPVLFAEQTEGAALEGVAEKARLQQQLEDIKDADLRAKRLAELEAEQARKEEARLDELDKKAKANAKQEIADARARYKAALKDARGKEDAESLKSAAALEYEMDTANALLRQKQLAGECYIQGVNLPVDSSPLLDVKRIEISGNTLVSTAEILSNMPVVFNSSSLAMSEASSDVLYDLRGVIDVILSPGTDAKISTRAIQGFTQYVLSVYQKHDYAGIYVYVPSESIVDGQPVDKVLKVNVLEAIVSEVKVSFSDVEGNKKEEGYISAETILGWSPVETGQVASKKKLDDYVNLLNQNPDRYVSAVIGKGTDPMSLNLAYDIYEVSPWHFYAQVDDSGTRERQWAPRIGMYNSNLLGFDDRLSVAYQADLESIEDNYSVYGSYDFPICGPELRMMLFGGYSQFDISPEGTGAFSFLGNGSFGGAQLRWHAMQFDGWFLDGLTSVSHERSKVTNSLFAGFGSDVQMDIWGVGAELHKRTDMANSTFGFMRYDAINGSSQAEFNLARTGATDDFVFWNLYGSHMRYLDADKVGRLSGTVRAVLTDDRLVPAKMSTYGGLYTVRGYDEDEIVADKGLLASIQYEYDLVAAHKRNMNGQDSTAQEAGGGFGDITKFALLCFSDMGRAKIESPLAGEQEVTEMWSVGVGTSITVGDYLDAQIYYGIPLRTTDDSPHKEGRFNFNFIFYW